MQSAGPYHIAGFCAGGAIAFESARQLVQAGEEVARVVLFGAPFPSGHRAGLAATQLRRVRHAARRHGPGLTAGSMSDRVAYVRGHLRERAGDAEEREDPALENRRRIEDATIDTVKRYEPGYYPGRVDAFLPSEAWRHAGEGSEEWKKVARQVIEHVGPTEPTATTCSKSRLSKFSPPCSIRLWKTTRERCMQLTDQVDRRAGLTREQFARDYLSPLRPVILTDAISHWRAMGRWTPQFFKEQYGQLQVTVDGETMALRDLIDRIEVSTSDNPAPYLHNQPLAEWPPELFDEVSPMPECTQPNWLESRFFPSRHRLSSVEAYIGGKGAQFPVLHYDNLHTHAFLMQLYGDKEYIVFSPEQTPFMYPRAGLEIDQVPDRRRARARPGGIPAVRPSPGRAF